MATPSPRPTSLPSLQDMVERPDLRAMLEEVRLDFAPASGAQRLLKQSEISARFRKRPKARGA